MQKKISIKPYIEIKDVTHRYGTITVLDQISCTIEKGSLTAILGPNGSGKTTLVRAIMGLLTPDKGTITINGKNPKEMRTNIGYVPQQLQFDRTLPITVKEFLEVYTCTNTHHQHKDSTHILAEVGLTEHIHQKIGTLSGGQFQRALIARALLHKKDILILDEPSAAIDAEGEETLYQMIEKLNREHGITCILISHDITMVHRFADSVLCLNKEKICQGTPSDTITPDVLKKLYGSEMGMYHHHH